MVKLAVAPLVTCIKASLAEIAPAKLGLGLNGNRGGLTWNDKTSTFRRRIKMESCIAEALTKEEMAAVKAAIIDVVAKWPGLPVLNRFTTDQEVLIRNATRDRRGSIVVYITEGKT